MTGLRIAYHQPSLHTVYAQRTIYEGFRHAFADLGHTFSTYTAGLDLERFLDEHDPQLFLTQSHFYYRKQVDAAVLARHRTKGCFVLTKVDFWELPDHTVRKRDAAPISRDPELIELLRSGSAGDAFFHVVEADDRRMEGFEAGVGQPLHTVPLAADARLVESRSSSDFAAPISYVGTFLPAKRQILEERVLPLRARGLKTYGQDWTPTSRLLGQAQRVGQYFNIPGLRALQKPSLRVEDEGTIYASSVISVNVHEDHQRVFGGDCNERSFKIPLAGGFQVVDDVRCLRSYFSDGVEIVIATSRDDWFEKVDHYLARPEERDSIIAAGKARVLADHTYHQRAQQLLEIAGLA